MTSVDEIAAGIRALQPAWPRQSSSERMAQVLAVANRALTRADVPPAKSALMSDNGSMASFDYRTWDLWLSMQLFAPATGVPPRADDASKVQPSAGADLDDHHAAELASTTAHEARHGEQWFLAARFAAAEGADADEIHAKQGLDREIAEQAVARKLDGVSSAARDLAEKMHKATVVDRKQNRKTGRRYGYKYLAAQRTRAIAARDALRDAPTAVTLSRAQSALDSLQTAIDLVFQKHIAYHQIPYEDDAHEVGAGAALAFEEIP